MPRFLLLFVFGMGIFLVPCDDASAQRFRIRNRNTCQSPTYQRYDCTGRDLVQPQFLLMVDPQTGQMFYRQLMPNEAVATQQPMPSAAPSSPPTPTLAEKPKTSPDPESTPSGDDIFAELSQATDETGKVQQTSLETPLTLEGPTAVEERNVIPSTPTIAPAAESDLIELEAPGSVGESTPETALKSGS